MSEKNNDMIYDLWDKMTSKIKENGHWFWVILGGVVLIFIIVIVIKVARKITTILSIIPDRKDKNKNQQYIQRLSNTARIETNTKGNITKSLLTPHLNKQKTNYVILDTSDLTTTIETVYALRDLRKQYDIQLVVLERGANLDSTDVSINDLAELRMIFPSVTNEANSSKREVFYQNFRRKFSKNPTKFSVRGYDVVMDMVNRMHAGIDGNIFEYGSQQIENKFAYINEAGGIYNNGVYILQYNPDLTITEAN